MDTRITICLTDGVLRGTSHQSDSGLPTELDLSALAALAPEINAASLARITELEAELLAAQSAPQPEVPPSLVAETISKLHAAFSGTLPSDAQAAFAMPYAIVRVLVEAEQYAMAARMIQGIAVPPELEEAKANLISLLPN